MSLGSVPLAVAPGFDPFHASPAEALFGVGIRPPSARQGRERSRGRFNLTGEAALNDSLASPFALLAAFVVAEPGAGWLAEWAVFDVVYAVAVAAVLGGLAGYGLGRLAIAMRERDLLSPELDGFVVIGAVLVVFGAAELIDAYGLLAVFAAGLGFRRYEFEHQYNERVHQGAQVAQNFAELVVILLLGSPVTVRPAERPGGYPAGSWCRCCSASSGRLPVVWSMPHNMQRVIGLSFRVKRKVRSEGRLRHGGLPPFPAGRPWRAPLVLVTWRDTLPGGRPRRSPR
jgi:Sodium/hydrogen exchanger family